MDTLNFTFKKDVWKRDVEKEFSIFLDFCPSLLWGTTKTDTFVHLKVKTKDPMIKKDLKRVLDRYTIGGSK